jgi:hypothetical protein
MDGEAGSIGVNAQTGQVMGMRSVKTLQVGLSLAEPGQAAWASA